LIVNPIIKDVNLNRVLVDGGSSLNILFLEIYHQIGLSMLALHLSQAPFHGIVPRATGTPVGKITLHVTFETQKKFYTKYIQFEVANFGMAYNEFLRRLARTKFMAIPHYAYLVQKMSGPSGVISIKGDVKRAYDYDQESCETANMLLASVELQDLKKSLAESPPGSDHA
jgi:hypothetical protein